ANVTVLVSALNTVQFTANRNTTISFRVQDTGGAASSFASDGTTATGVDIAVNPNSFNFVTNHVSVAPTASDRTVSTVEDTVYNLRVLDLGFSDAADSQPNNLKNVIITALPQSGGLLRDQGQLVTVNQTIPVADFANGLVT